MSNYYIAAGCQHGTVYIYDSQDYEELFILVGNKKNVNSLCFNKDGTQLASASHDKTVKTWNTSNGLEIFRVRNRGKIHQ